MINDIHTHRSTLFASSLLKKALQKGAYPLNYLPVLEQFLGIIFPADTTYLTRQQQTKLTQVLSALKADTPIEYITKAASFYGLTFTVSRSVLIPRPLTEELVEQVLMYLRDAAQKRKSITIVDIGTGSGAIIIAIVTTLRKEFPDLEKRKWRFIATEISKRAIRIAQKNIQAHGLAEHVELIEANVLPQQLVQEFCAQNNDCVIVSNPPYIDQDAYDKLDHSVKAYEPKRALIASPQFLRRFTAIFRELQKANKHTALFLEYSLNGKATLFSAENTTDALQVLQKP